MTGRRGALALRGSGRYPIREYVWRGKVIRPRLHDTGQRDLFGKLLPALGTPFEMMRQCHALADAKLPIDVRGQQFARLLAVYRISLRWHASSVPATVCGRARDETSPFQSERS
jgi:hypothetical protein